MEAITKDLWVFIETNDDGSALIAMVTHEGPEQAISDTLNTLANSDSLLGEPMVMHILGE